MAASGVLGLTGSSVADPIGGGGGDSFPKNYSEKTYRETSEAGQEYLYTSEVGDRIEFNDGPIMVDGTWRYAYKTMGLASVAKERQSDGAVLNGSVMEGDHEVEVDEADAPSEVSTYYHGNADWGVGASDHEKQNYSWDNATIDTVQSLWSYFSSIAGTTTTAADIASYWFKAAKSEMDLNGIDHHWDRYLARPQVSHFLRYEHAIPPEEELSVDQVDVFTYNRLFSTKYQGSLSTGTSTPTGDFVHSYGISHAAIPSPSTATAAQRSQFGIKKTRAENAPAIATAHGLSGRERVHVATKPHVRVWDATNVTRK